MDNFMLISAVCLSGLLAGSLLSIIAPEELRPGNKYFYLLANAIIAVMVALLIKPHVSAISMSAISFLVFAGLTAYARSLRLYWIIYLATLISLFIARQDPITLAAQGSLLFLLSMPLATLYIAENTTLAKAYATI